MARRRTFGTKSGDRKAIRIVLPIVFGLAFIAYLGGTGDVEQPAPASTTTATAPAQDETEPELHIDDILPPEDFDRVAAFADWGVPSEYMAPDDIPAPVADDNLMDGNLYLIVDGSGSMADVGCSDGKPKADAARGAILSFLDKVPAQGVNLGLILFDERGAKIYSELTDDDDAVVREAIEGLTPGGGTPLGQALQYAVTELRRQAIRQRGYGDYRIVVVTDGLAGDPQEMYLAVGDILKAPITLHTIGFCIGEDHPLNLPGRLIYVAAMDTDGLTRGLDQVLAESEDFDVGTFTPTGEAAGSGAGSAPEGGR